MAAPKPSAPPEPILNVNDHALALCKACPEPLGTMILEICKTLSIQPWQFFVGHVIKADQRSELHAPLLLPEWTETSETPVVLNERRCRSCGLIMKEARAGALFCCNYCGSGRFQREQVHHPNCEFFIVPKKFLTRELGPKVAAIVPPTEPSARAKFEEEAFERHLRESELAEAQANGLPPTPEVTTTESRVGSWA